MLMAPSACHASSLGSSSLRSTVLSLLTLDLGSEPSPPCFSNTVCVCPQILLFLPVSYPVISLHFPLPLENKSRKGL